MLSFLCFALVTLSVEPTCKVCHYAYTPRQATITREQLFKAYYYVTSRSRRRFHGSRSAVLGIVRKESSMNRFARSRVSSANGLSGFLRATRKQYKVPHNGCVACEVSAIIRYSIDRYGSVSGAYYHHQKKGWY